MEPLRVQILGVGGAIGKVHKRIFESLGAVVTTDSPDVVSICTPPEVHYVEIIDALDQGKAVFCEKPLFWDGRIVLPRLRNIKEHINRRVFMNAPNTAFINVIWDKVEYPIKEFTLRFHTNGRHRFKNIAVDLLPHAFSMLIHLMGVKEITMYKEHCCHENDYVAYMMYGNTYVKLYFYEGACEKLLSFSINDMIFSRVQEGEGETYRAYTMYEGEKYKVGDPFHASIKEFCDNYEMDGDGFWKAEQNMLMMAKCLRGEE